MIEISTRTFFVFSFVSDLKTWQVTPSTVAKVIPKSLVAMTFLPLEDQALLAMVNSMGHLAFWNVLGEPRDPIVTEPHADEVTDVGVHRKDPGAVFTSSYDGSLRVTDLIAQKVREPFRSPNATSVQSFDFMSRGVIILGNSCSQAILLDTRQKLVRGRWVRLLL